MRSLHPDQLNTAAKHPASQLVRRLLPGLLEYLGMAGWMVARRHAWRGTVAMSAVMYVPFLLLAPLFWLGTISGDALLTGGHLLMIPAMAFAMPLTHRHRIR